MSDIHHVLITSGVVTPVVLGGTEERSWADCDLASLAENRLADATDPGNIDQECREEWRRRATTAPCGLPSQRRFEACFWLLEGTERVGTVALASSLIGSRLLGLSSLYVFRSQRRKGVGTRALGRLRQILSASGLGIRLETSWAWQPAVHFYLKAGFWVHGWKRDLAFRWDPCAPSPLLQIGSQSASLSIDLDGRRVVLACAKRDGETLVLHEPARSAELDQRIEALMWQASSTLSLGLALHGWPLVRSREAWERGRHSDFGPPEALAYKIGIWEAWDRKHGWLVSTPPIAGLRYPTWEELQAEWSEPRSS